MADKIRKDDKGYQFIGMGETWHRKGIVKPNGEPATVEEVTSGTRCNYPVVTAPIFRHDGTKVPDKKEVFREDTNEYFGVVGKDWTPLQNTEAFEFFDRVVGQGDAIYTSAGVLGKGEKFFLQAKLPDFMQVADDVVDMYLLFTNTHDGSASVDVRFTPVRVVCNNTLNAALQGKGAAKNIYRIRHTKNVKARFHMADEILGISNRYMKEMNDVFNRMVNTQMTKEETTAAFIKTIHPSIKPGIDLDDFHGKTKRIIAEIEAAGRSDVSMDQYKGTAWHAFNAVTFYVDHMKDYRNKTRFEGSVYGTGADMRQGIFNALVPMLV